MRNLPIGVDLAFSKSIYASQADKVHPNPDTLHPKPTKVVHKQAGQAGQADWNSFRARKFVFLA